MAVNDKLATSFPGYRSGEMSVTWDELKKQLPLGQSVSGEVVLREEFRVFADIGVGFPALLLVVRFLNISRSVT